MSMKFNLVTDPWVPVRYPDKSDLVSLETLFMEAEKIVDLDCVPHERISIIRLLVCITQSVFEPPEDSDEWDGYGDGMETTIPKYLNGADILPHFELFGDGPRFLQVSFDKKPDPVSASKLIPHLATGNNATLFDQEGGTSNRSFGAPILAKALLVFQCFYPLYGAGYKGKGPCVDGNMLHTVILGANLLEIIKLNCLDERLIRIKFSMEGIGRPIWELDASDPEFEAVATQSYLGRLVPMHRSLWFLDDSSGFYLRKDGLIYPTFESFIESTATVVLRKKKDAVERRLLPARLDKAIWRDLHAITVLRESENELRAPLNLQSHGHEFSEEVPLWIGALVTDLKAKILDVLESRITVPEAMFGRDGRELYQNGILWAETQSNQLYGAVKRYGASLMNDKPPTDLAKQYYWTALEGSVDRLLSIVKDPDLLGGRPFGEGNDAWSDAVWVAARDAFERVCPRQTPRQLQAFATGLKSLKPRGKKKNSKRKETVKA